MPAIKALLAFATRHGQAAALALLEETYGLTATEALARFKSWTNMTAIYSKVTR